MRLFVAAEPSNAVRAAAAETAGRVRERLESIAPLHGVRWVPHENLHLTVWFLGEVSDARARAVLDALSTPLSSRSFDLHLSGLGVFPPSGAPRVIWMGVREGIDELARAHDEVGERLAPWGFPPEARAYSAHLTLARLKEPLQSAVRAGLRDMLRHDRADAGRCRIDALTVFRSRTDPRGAIYEPLQRVPLS